MKHSLSFIACGLLFALASAAPAFSHAHLTAAAPAEKSSVASPAEIDLTFSEAINLKFSGIEITGPGSSAVKVGDAMLMNGDTMLMVSMPGKLEPGDYELRWHVLSADGHKTKGSYRFTVKP